MFGDTVSMPNSASIQTEAFLWCIEQFREEMCSESRVLAFRQLFVFKPIICIKYLFIYHNGRFLEKHNWFIHYSFDCVAKVFKLTHHIAKIAQIQFFFISNQLVKQGMKSILITSSSSLLPTGFHSSPVFKITFQISV